jgi:putative hemolysin
MEIFLLLFLILVNGLFAMAEMAIVSSRKARLQQWADEGHGGAATALALANDPSKFLSTIQVGITVIGISSGALGEATLARSLGDWLLQLGLAEGAARGGAFALVVVGLTIASLMLGELIPKRLALINPELVASALAAPVNGFAAITRPLVYALGAMTDGALRLIGRRPSEEPPVTEEEIKVLMEQGAEAGVFEKHEQQIVSRVFRLDELRVTGVMTPRTDIVYLDLEEPLAANLREITRSSHSRFPVVRGSLDQLEGVVAAKVLLEDLASGQAVDLAARVAKPLYVPTSLTVMQVVEAFKKHRQTLAFVVDEHGELQGLVTLNDVMEALVGDIATVESEADLDMVRRDDGSWLVDGTVTIDRFRDVIGVAEEMPEQDTGSYHTLGGFVMLQLGRVPQVLDRFEWEGYRFEVIDMDRNRVDKLLVTRLPPADAPASTPAAAPTDS